KVVTDQNFQLEPIQVAAIKEDITITLNNVFFDFDEAILKTASYPELNRIIDVMKKSDKMLIQIAGHTDSMGPDQYNLVLSERRAKAVADYPIEKGGLNKDRIRTVHHGEPKPAVTNETEEGRSK